MDEQDGPNTRRHIQSGVQRQNYQRRQPNNLFKTGEEKENVLLILQHARTTHSGAEKPILIQENPENAFPELSFGGRCLIRRCASMDPDVLMGSARVSIKNKESGAHLYQSDAGTDEVPTNRRRGGALEELRRKL